MTPQELDRWLRGYSEYEARFRSGWENPRMLQDTEWVVINGRSIPVLSLPNKNVPLDGQKHARFHAFPIHVHPWVELNYMYSGCCTQRVNGVPIELRQGQMLLLDQNTAHELPPLGEEDILLNLFVYREYLNAGFFNRLSHKNLLSQFFVNAITDGMPHDSYIFFASQNSRRLPLYIQEFFCEIADPSEYSADILSSLFILILTELIQTYSDSLSFRETLAEQRTSILPVLKYIEERYKSIALDETAAFFNLNPNYLSNLLKKRTGSSFRELVCQQRMAVAEQLLLNSDLAITEVAGAVGYENTTFFYKKFREHTGLSPAAYRRKGRAAK